MKGRDEVRGRILALALAALIICSVPMLSETFEAAAASEHINSYLCYIESVGGGEIRVHFEVYGTGIMSEIGAAEIVLQQSQDGGEWHSVQTFSAEDYPQMMTTDASFHTGCVDYTGTVGAQYRAAMTAYASDGRTDSIRSAENSAIVDAGGGAKPQEPERRTAKYVAHLVDDPLLDNTSRIILENGSFVSVPHSELMNQGFTVPEDVIFESIRQVNEDPAHADHAHAIEAERSTFSFDTESGTSYRIYIPELLPDGYSVRSCPQCGSAVLNAGRSSAYVYIYGEADACYEVKLSTPVLSANCGRHLYYETEMLDLVTAHTWLTEASDGSRTCEVCDYTDPD